VLKELSLKPAAFAAALPFASASAKLSRACLK
jgi:hypothetical protein